MTRRGSLVYYLAAWVCGCSFTSGCVWLVIRSSMGWYVAGFLGFYALSLIFGAIVSYLFALLLRGMSAKLGFSQLWHWVAAGAALAVVLILSLGGLGVTIFRARAPVSEGFWQAALLLLLAGPAEVFDAGIWPAIPAGAATACVLYYIQRAFEPRP